jgi:hypothetical protein
MPLVPKLWRKNFKEKDNEILGTNVILKAKKPLPYLPTTVPVFDEEDEILDLPYRYGTVPTIF